MNPSAEVALEMDIKPIGRTTKSIQSQPITKEPVQDSITGDRDNEQKISPDHRYIHVSPVVLQSYKFSDSSVETISFLPNGNAMVLSEDQTLMQVDKNGKSKMKMDVRGFVMDMCGYSDEEILITHESHRCVYMQSLTSVEGTTVIVTTKPLIPADARPSPDGSLAIIAVDKWDMEITSKSKRQLCKYKTTGELLKTVEVDSFGDKLFVQPGRVRVNRITGNIAVCNYTDHGRDHVVVFDKDLNLLFRTFGGKDVFMGDKRLPKSFKRNVVFNDLVFDDDNNMVVVDTKSESVQLLNKDGFFIKTLYKDKSDPRSVSLDSNGNLWVGCYTGDIRIIKYREKIILNTGEVDCTTAS